METAIFADALLGYFVRQNRGNDEAVAANDRRAERGWRVTAGFPENFLVLLADGRHENHS